jgi:hypothetical protein
VAHLPQQIPQTTDYAAPIALSFLFAIAWAYSNTKITIH